jgi:ribosomal protein S27E
LTISSANQLLIDNKLFTGSDIKNKTLKKILEKNQIPHATQTIHTPRQWRIPLSEKGKIKQNKKSKPATKKRKPDYQPVVKKVKCPGCNSNLDVHNDIINSQRLTCPLCGRNFKNPFLLSDPIYNNNQKKWAIAIIIIVVLVVIGIIIDNNSNSSSNSSSYSNYNNDLNKEKSVYKFSSTYNDLEDSKDIIKTNRELTYHTFDFNKKTVTQRGQSKSGQWVDLTFPMKSFRQEGVTYVIKVDYNGITEIWFSPIMNNLGYDFYNGQRISFYGIKQLD